LLVDDQFAGWINVKLAWYELVLLITLFTHGIYVLPP
jgi:hypothetical protein